MKTLIFSSLLLLSTSAYANRISEVLLMAQESIQEQLGMPDADNSLSIVRQELVPSQKNASFAIKTNISLRSAHDGHTTLWTCESQFVKTAEFFKVTTTDCINLGQ